MIILSNPRTPVLHPKSESDVASYEPRAVKASNYGLVTQGEYLCTVVGRGANTGLAKASDPFGLRASAASCQSPVPVSSLQPRQS